MERQFLRRSGSCGYSQQTAGDVSEDFLNWNIASLEYPVARYTEQTNGLRSDSQQMWARGSDRGPRLLHE